jgi:hypothetical protein
LLTDIHRKLKLTSALETFLHPKMLQMQYQAIMNLTPAPLTPISLFLKIAEREARNPLSVLLCRSAFCVLEHIFIPLLGVFAQLQACVSP